MVEHLLAMERLASSNLVFRSKEILLRGDVAKWIRRGSAKPLFSGSNPLVASIFKYNVAVSAPAENLKC